MPKPYDGRTNRGGEKPKHINLPRSSPPDPSDFLVAVAWSSCGITLSAAVLLLSVAAIRVVG